MYYIIAHALFKALLFLSVGATLFAGGERDVYRASGFMRISPMLFVLFSLLYGDSPTHLLSASPVYTLSGLLESMVGLSLGVGLYLALSTRRGRVVMTTIKNAFITLDSAVIMVVAGFVALGGLALFSL